MGESNVSAVSEVRDRFTALGKPRRRGKSSAIHRRSPGARRRASCGRRRSGERLDGTGRDPADPFGRPPRGRRTLARRRRAPPRAAPPRQLHPDCLDRRHWQHAGHGPFAWRQDRAGEHLLRTVPDAALTEERRKGYDRGTKRVGSAGMQYPSCWRMSQSTRSPASSRHEFAPHHARKAKFELRVSG